MVSATAAELTLY